MAGACRHAPIGSSREPTALRKGHIFFVHPETGCRCRARGGELPIDVAGDGASAPDDEGSTVARSTPARKSFSKNLKKLLIPGTAIL
jgi:hypothetical protein